MSKWQPTQRLEAERAWLLMVLSFGVSVVGTRVYLEATGYPQIGNSVLHFAHVLWGGLLLFISLCVILTYGNRWKYSLGAILGGAGVGLFIDEVGKFITQSNDYFFPFAAPIIYGSIVLTTFIYLQVRRQRPPSTRADLYWILDLLKDVADQDFDTNERAKIQQALARALEHSETEDERRTVEAAQQFVQSLPTIVPPRPNAIARMQNALLALEARCFSRGIHRSLLIIAFGLVAFSGLTILVFELLLAGDNTIRAEVVSSIINEGIVNSAIGFQWLLIHATLTGITGLLFLVAAILMLRWDRRGIDVAQFALLLQLTVVNLLAFYFNQFTMISSALAGLLLLLAVLRYRSRFLTEPL